MTCLFSSAFSEPPPLLLNHDLRLCSAQGGDVLDRLLRTGKFPEADAVNVTQQLMDALQHLHQCDIVHRDVKPENILLMSGDPASPDYCRIMLADFGMSQHRPNIGTNVLKTMIGTPEFAAPEMMSIARYGHVRGVPDSTHYSCQVDNWAAGCVLYTMISAATPFSSEGRSNVPVMIDCIIKGKYAFTSSVWNSVTPETKDLIKALILVDPRARLTARLALAHPGLDLGRWSNKASHSPSPWTSIRITNRADALGSGFAMYAQQPRSNEGSSGSLRIACQGGPDSPLSVPRDASFVELPPAERSAHQPHPVARQHQGQERGQNAEADVDGQKKERHIC